MFAKEKRHVTVIRIVRQIGRILGHVHLKAKQSDRWINSYPELSSAQPALPAGN
jgi:hypothetical protein